MTFNSHCHTLPHVTKPGQPLPHMRSCLVLLLGAMVLTACGGGSATSDVATNKAASAAQVNTTEALPITDTTAFARSAALSSADLAAAEQQAQAAEALDTSLDELQAGQIAAKSAYQSGAVARKALATRIPVYRFSNSSTGAHFFTTSVSERDNVANTLAPPYSLEGEAFSVASAYSPGLSPVHRFYNTQTGVHFYTISETERANVAANFPQFNHEGVAYHASQVAGAGLTPFYRFYVPSKGFHFYTARESEKDSIIANLAATYTYEGIGYYVLDSDWRAEKLPHTGVPSSQCYQAGSNSLVACSSGGPTGLNPQQDGHRADINRMSYSAVGSNPLIQCVKDNVTGLVWEGKDTAGPRAGGNTYTHLGNGLVSDTSGYVAAVNMAKLCGFNDWRLPSAQELINIGDHGLIDYRPILTPKINAVWFPNTAVNIYWSSSSDSANPDRAWYVNFNYLTSSVERRSDAGAVRLVRGSAPGRSRFSYSSLVYGSDGANNMVNDAWTGLQWRRCEEGRAWSGSACTGALSTFTHEQALAHARQQAGWRLPNVKELSSLPDLSVSDGANIDPTAFPSALSKGIWSSSPDAFFAASAGVVDFSGGSVGGSGRSNAQAVRLVRSGQ